ncbi:MAG: class I SAM-dependent RNA methyltransferase [Kiritimatiellae bacterium]|nr:class I SAM-dependent RNA methyltransferase [Kiritimatiellia bacterium]
MTTTVYIAKNVYGGDGLGRLGDGRIVFVPGAFAGESVKAEIVAEKKNFVKARLVEVVDPSPERIAPGRTVPGMVYASLSRKGELAAKESQLVEALDRARLWSGPVALIEKGDDLNYRNKATYHFGSKDPRGGNWLLGYHNEESHEIFDIGECDPLVVKGINEKLPEIRRNMLALVANGSDSVRNGVLANPTVTVRWSERSGARWFFGKSKDSVPMREVTCGRVFEVPVDGFYQVNPKVGEALVKTLTGEFTLKPSDWLVDLYCGVGVFGLSCAKTGYRGLVGIESGRQAVEFAKKNAASQGVAGARFIADEVRRALPRVRLSPATAVIADPPRGGMESFAAEYLSRSKAARIFYVSCDVATMVRDLRILSKNYDIAKIAWFDMFPRTARFETLVTLERKTLH